MPSPAARQLTAQHRSRLAVVARAVARPVRHAAQTATTSDIDRWFEQVLVRLLAAIRAGWQVARAQTTRYLREHAEIEGRQVDPVPALWVPERVITSLRVTGPVEFKRHLERVGDELAARRAMAETMPAAAMRHALAGDRDTVMATFADEDSGIVGWRRVVDADPCAFCAMLASRGAVYTRATVGFDAHDGCGCSAEPLYEHEDEPPEVQRLIDAWRKATVGTSGAESIRAWRRFWDQQREQQTESGASDGRDQPAGA